MYHVNPANGEPGQCRAKLRCPFGLATDHFATEEQARTAYEAVMSGAARPPLSWLLSPKGEPLPSADVRALALECFQAAEAVEEQASDKFSSLNWYTMGGYEAINGVLRGQTHDCWGHFIEDWRREAALKAIGNIDAIFATVEDRPRVTYRYAAAREGKSVRDTIKVLVDQDTYTDPAFMSTSASADYPLYQVLDSPQDRFLMEIVSTKTLDLQPEGEIGRGDVQSHELEVLLPRDVTFHVVGVEWRKRALLGSLRDTLLPDRDWMDSPTQRRIRKASEVTVPVVRLVQVG